MLIPGTPGKQIRIDELTLSMFSMSTNATGTVWVTANVNGVITELARWTENSTTSKPKSATPEFIAEAGADVTLEWRLLTSNSTIRVKINEITYTYSMIEEIKVEVPQCLVVTECKTEEEAEALANTLIGQGSSVYIRKTILNTE
jgi:hypothetical protein